MCVRVYTYIQADTDVHARYTYRVVMDGSLPWMHRVYTLILKRLLLLFTFMCLLLQSGRNIMQSIFSF